jgi:hypothetical protein
MRINVKRQRFLLHHFDGRGRNQIRFEITVLAATGHPDISGSQPVAQFGECAQFIEVPVHSARWKYIGPPARFHKTGRHVFRQRSLAAGVEVAEQLRASNNSAALGAAWNSKCASSSGANLRTLPYRSSSNAR